MYIYNGLNVNSFVKYFFINRPVIVRSKEKKTSIKNIKWSVDSCNHTKPHSPFTIHVRHPVHKS